MILVFVGAAAAWSLDFIDIMKMKEMVIEKITGVVKVNEHVAKVIKGVESVGETLKDASNQPEIKNVFKKMGELGNAMKDANGRIRDTLETKIAPEVERAMRLFSEENENRDEL